MVWAGNVSGMGAKTENATFGGCGMQVKTIESEQLVSGDGLNNRNFNGVWIVGTAFSIQHHIQENKQK